MIINIVAWVSPTIFDHIILKKQACGTVTFPNTFTPNGDGINDVFVASPISRANHFNLSVYNRYGTLVFSSTDIHAGWDGTYNSHPLPVGTYFWVAAYINDDNLPTTQSGSVALIR